MDKRDDRIMEITDSVKWIGILDYDIKTFDIVMTTEYGTTYNSYFIDADKKTLIEVVKDKFFDTYLKKLQTLTNPEDISYIILDHTEPDHSGSLKRMLELAPSATVVGSGAAIRYLEDMLNIPFRSIVVKDGDTLDLGNRTLKFISAPNLHWPDTIYTWLGDENILFTCDSFGAHYCRYEMSDDLNDDYLEAFKYYFDVILKPYSKFMLKAIEKIRPLDIKYICPGHGPILSRNWKYFVDLTEKYAQDYVNAAGVESEGNILIAYVSAYGYTAKAAELVAEGIREAADLKVKVVDIEHIGLDELQTLLISSRALLIGSPTINQNTLLPVYKLFALINPIRDRGKLCGAFGSYGWSGEAVKIILETVRSLKLRIFEETSEFKFMPSGSKETQLRSFGKKFAEKFVEESAAE
jgi:flavorubredoxin